MWERNKDLFFQLFMHSLVDSCMCPDQGWTHNLGVSGWPSNQLSCLVRAFETKSICKGCCGQNMSGKAKNWVRSETIIQAVSMPLEKSQLWLEINYFRFLSLSVLTGPSPPRQPRDSCMWLCSTEFFIGSKCVLLLGSVLSACLQKFYCLMQHSQIRKKLWMIEDLSKFKCKYFYFLNILFFFSKINAINSFRNYLYYF